MTSAKFTVQSTVNISKDLGNRSFAVQHTEQGWVILNFPNWSSCDPVNHGSFGTFQLAYYSD
jgi:hypothetical protein